MASTPSLFDQFVVELNGILLSENQEIEFSLEGDDQDIETILLGWAGQTPSPKKTMCTLKNVVPPSTFNFDPFAATLNSTPTTMRLQRIATGQSYTSQGFIRKPKGSSGVGKPSSLDWEFHGTPSTFT